MNLANSWVPLGSKLRMYSAPTMANKNDLGLRLSVEKKTQPPGLAKLAQARTTEPGSGTCSSISMHVTTSNAPGSSAAMSSTLISRYCTPGVWASMACSCATFKALVERSMPVTCAPWRAMASDKMPPPQPTSKALAPAMGANLAIQSKRRGLIWCSGRNSLSGSHQRWAKSENFASSAGSALRVLMRGLS